MLYTNYTYFDKSSINSFNDTIGRVLKEVIPDIENSSDQEKGDEKQDQESGVNKSLVQIPEEHMHITGKLPI